MKILRGSRQSASCGVQCPFGNVIFDTLKLLSDFKEDFDLRGGGVQLFNQMHIIQYISTFPWSPIKAKQMPLVEIDVTRHTSSTGWWFQPLWKICSSKWESSPNRDENWKIFETTTQSMIFYVHHSGEATMCRRYQWATRRMARSLRSFCDSCGSLRLTSFGEPKMYWNVRCFLRGVPLDWKPTSKCRNIIQNAEAISIQPYSVEESKKVGV